MDKKELSLFALDLKENFPLNRTRRYDVKYIHIIIDEVLKKYLGKKN